jgi:hypothetical protein
MESESELLQNRETTTFIKLPKFLRPMFTNKAGTIVSYDFLRSAKYAINVKFKFLVNLVFLTEKGLG